MYYRVGGINSNHKSAGPQVDIKKDMGDYLKRGKDQ